MWKNKDDGDDDDDYDDDDDNNSFINVLGKNNKRGYRWALQKPTNESETTLQIEFYIIHKYSFT